jgi:hypothetical protein
MVDISTRTVNATITKKDQIWRVEIFQEPGLGVQIIQLRRVQEYAPTGDALGNKIEYSLTHKPADDSRFAAVLTSLRTILDDLAIAAGVIGAGPQ